MVYITFGDIINELPAIKMKTILNLLVIIIFNLGQLLAQSNSTFPESWDVNHDLRGTNGKVLAWTHKIDTIRPFEYKNCITIVVGKDSLGKDEYFVSEMYTNEKPFNKWHHSSIHYASDSPLIPGFQDEHIAQFDHKASEQEIYKLLARWKFKLKEDDWITIECGVDEDLWVQYFGFKPDKNFKMNKIK